MAVAFSPVYPELEGIERLAAETPRQVANAITIFAVVNLAVMIWFTGPVARLAIEQVRLELAHLGTCVERWRKRRKPWLREPTSIWIVLSHWMTMWITFTPKF